MFVFIRLMTSVVTHGPAIIIREEISSNERGNSINNKKLGVSCLDQALKKHQKKNPC